MKFIAVIAAVVCMFAGCISGNDDNFYNTPTNATMQTDFGSDVYVWEGFIFSTNRVENAK